LNLDHPPHAIILVPELDLLADATQFGGEFFKEACTKLNAFLHILDISELSRIVQAAEMIARTSEGLSRMEAFDGYLIERTKYSIRQQTPAFEILLRIN
jgi:hypothetical protein